MPAQSALITTRSSSTWLHRWIYSLAAGFMFSAAALRAILVFQDSPLLGRILLLLAVWLLVFLGEALLTRGLNGWSALLIGLEILFVLALLLVARTDFFAFLFAIPGMQAMQRFTSRVVVILLGLTALVTFLMLIKPYGALQAFALGLIYFSGSILLIAYIGSTRRARTIQDQQQELVADLQQTNRQLEINSQQMRQLAAERERQRLARELHDSVTQTIFSMTLTTQSALLLLERDRLKVASQLDRLEQLSRSALAEMQVLISRLAPDKMVDVGFIDILKQHLADRQRMDNLVVNLEVDGHQGLTVLEEQNLFRIAQEALNNVVKHAGVERVVVKLHLAEPFWMEIEDHGAGFDAGQARNKGGMGVAGMQERATEIGWTLRVESSPGSGTRILVKK